jgi:hypothetical protein
MELEIDAKTAIGSDGLTAEFRDSSSYRKMRADLLRLDPSVTDFEADQVIFWFVANPLVFETEEGKAMLASLDKRNPHPRFSTAHSITEDGEQQSDAKSVAGREDGGREFVRFESGLYAALAGDGADDGAAAAVASATTDDAAATTGTSTAAAPKDAAGCVEPDAFAGDSQ